MGSSHNDHIIDLLRWELYAFCTLLYRVLYTPHETIACEIDDVLHFMPEVREGIIKRLREGYGIDLSERI